MEPQAALIRTIVASVPTCILFAGSLVLLLREKAPSSYLQVVGTGCLVVVVLAHICEALQFFPSMGWGLERSAGHYLNVGELFLPSYFSPSATCFICST